MSRSRTRNTRLRLVVGILAGVFVGTAHALVSHVMLRPGPGDPAAVYRVGPHGIAAAGPDGGLMLVVVDGEDGETTTRSRRGARR